MMSWVFKSGMKDDGHLDSMKWIHRNAMITTHMSSKSPFMWHFLSTELDDCPEDKNQIMLFSFHRDSHMFPLAENSCQRLDFAKINIDKK